MEAFEIDLDSECVWLDDAWLNRDDLVRKIKSMMDAGDFAIARPSEALEALTRAIAQARLLPVRIAPELFDGLSALAQQAGRPAGALAREAIAAYVAAAAQPSAASALADAAVAPEAGGAPRIEPIPLVAKVKDPPADADSGWFGGK